MTFPRILAALAAAFLGLVPVGAGAQTISGGGGGIIPGAVTDCSSIASLCLNFQNPVGTTVFSVNKSGVVILQSSSSAGNVTLTPSNLGLNIGGGGVGDQLRVGQDGSGNPVLATGGTSSVAWYSGVGISGSIDTRLARAAAGVMRLDKDGAGGQPIVSGLNTCNSGAKGSRSMVTDATVAASTNFGAAVTGGGANVVPVYCDGTSWKIG